jgi:transketolase
MRRALVTSLVGIARKDPRLLLLTGDLGFMVLEEFLESCPSRFFNVGVAEANMVGLATGLASCGYIPFLYSIATFASMRGYEQIRNGPVLHELPVRIVGTGGGFEYGYAGPTHYALEDLGIARIQPGLTVIAPADHIQTITAVRATYDLPGPIYYRIGKRDDYVIPNLKGRFRLGRVEIVREGSDLLIASIGSITAEACAAAEKLAEQGIESTVAVVASLRPAPIDDLRELLGRFKLCVTVEEHYVDGGLGSIVAEVDAEGGYACRLVRCGVRRSAPGESGSEAYMRAQNALSSGDIARRAHTAFGEITK